ncbi:hypothetical protein NOS3756_60280 (plasmid) [Nostoc sp. NIES-3756]|uniref:hypothetical protein n=1 Tax=Nostoc sp. NIES-3756 TaxID=1751286 RepID=UPI000720D9B1|nr:hypothetical protein [Nostoc sp. NIES-3756]BAT57016.1 hypothetical protein NOS3756_60280 [Nostoc sp. NIES-3756]
MPTQDKTGDKYEQFLAATLSSLGYSFNGVTGKNYLHPNKRSTLVFPGTYIQPDLVVRDNSKVKAILYCTHWSETRSSKKKFWRTWEELAQQKLAVSQDFLAINCLFEALPTNSEPSIYITSDELPIDVTRDKKVPIQFNGWDAGIGWAMVEAFDVSLVFPEGYQELDRVVNSEDNEFDIVTSNLIKEALDKSHKSYFVTQWNTLDRIRQRTSIDRMNLVDTRNNYRVGLLHIYLIYRLISRILNRKITELNDIIKALTPASGTEISLNSLLKVNIFNEIGLHKTCEIFDTISKIEVNHNNKKEKFCNIRFVTNPNTESVTYWLSFNTKLHFCLQDLKLHISNNRFIQAIYRYFDQFDQAYGVDEAIDDLAFPNLVKDKESFVRQIFFKSINNEMELNELLQSHCNNISHQREIISKDKQNWVFEMLLYMLDLKSAEDIQKRFKDNFEKSGHQLRPHAPYGDQAKAVAFLLQGRDICEQWSPRSRKKKTLTKDEFRTLAWETVAKCITQAIIDKQSSTFPPEKVINDYLRNKLMRILSSDLHGFYIVVEHYLGDICFLNFTDDSDDYKEDLKNRICPSWQTDVIVKIWGSNMTGKARPLETWMEGVSHNGKWLIKVQSAPNNPGDKTKELAGRCRALRIAWSHGSKYHNRCEWSFSERNLPKLALVLDGEWDSTKKHNLYEAGWDWVGDISQIEELRQLIQNSSD